MLLLLAKDLLQQQQGLPEEKQIKIIIMSATIDTSTYTQYFKKSEIKKSGNKKSVIPDSYLPIEVQGNRSYTLSYSIYFTSRFMNCSISQSQQSSSVFLLVEKNLTLNSDAQA